MRSINRYVHVGSLMNIRIGSESFMDFGFDGGNSLLTMGTARKQGQRKDAREDHRCQKVRALALIPC